MERGTVMKTFHGDLAPKSPTLRDRDASFSSHLQPHHHHNHTIGSGRCRALDDSTTELSIFDAHKYFNEVANNDINNNNSSIQKVTTSISSSNSRVSPLVNNTNNMDTERITVQEKGDTTRETTRYSSASSSADGYTNNIRNYRTRSFHAATPTGSSEASWNSQAGLLSHPPGAIPVSMKNPPNSKGLNKKLRASLSKPICLLRRKCPCNGKKSVQVIEKMTPEKPKTQIPIPPPRKPKDHSMNLKTQDHVTSPKKPEPENHHKNILPITPNNKWVVDQRETFVTTTTKSPRLQPHRVVTPSLRVPFTESFTFPVLNPNSSTPTPTKPDPGNGVVSEEEDPARDSLEVFQPPMESNVIAADVDDVASDASSDLFEIESFSTTTATQSTSAAYPITLHRNRRDSTDEEAAALNNSNNNNNNNMNNGFFFSRRSVECYAPSEASIEWSVTTAEGCDRASVAAAEDESGGVVEKWKRQGSGNGLLVSCRCEKAVSVGPQPVKSEGQRGATKHVSVVSVNKPQLQLARSHNNTNTARVSFALAT